MSFLSELKRKVKIAKLTLELKRIQATHWYTRKKLAYIQWQKNRWERRRDYLESRRFQRGDDDE